MLRFRQMKSLQKFASIHANVHNHFNLERHLVDRKTFKERRAAALVDWRQIAVLYQPALRLTHVGDSQTDKTGCAGDKAGHRNAGAVLSVAE